MKLFRVFPWDGKSLGAQSGGPLFIPRHLQADTRHGIVHQDGVFYASTSATSAIAERLQSFSGACLSNDDFERFPGTTLALAQLEWNERTPLLDLRDAATLAQQHISPTDIASSDRAITQRLSERLFEMGIPGFFWWSSLNSSWTNVTLFQSRLATKLKLAGPILPLQTELPELINAAKAIRIQLEKT